MKPGQRVLFALRKMIVSGELKSGMRIAEIPTAQALGVSRMPVRTALRALEQEGLVVRLGARGYTPRAVSPRHIRDAIAVRGVLEGYAARLAAERGVDSASEQRLAALLEEGEALFVKGGLDADGLDRYRQYNLSFHDTLVTAAANNALTEALHRNNHHPLTGAGAFALDEADLEMEYIHLLAAHRQHRQVFVAILGRDGGGAEAIMRDHALAAMRNALPFEGSAEVRTALAACALSAD